MKCPNCGAEASGRFCSTCGSALGASACSKCGASLVPGARFCNQCGTAVGGAARGRSARDGGTNHLPWYIAGGVLLVLAIILVVPLLRDDDRVGPASGGAAQAPFAAPGSGTPPPLTGTPREQADRLFNRIMSEREQGDTARAKFFAPMGVQAYQNAEPLDNDGLYHLAAIQLVGGDFAAARRTADRMLRDNPKHLLALAIAGEAASKAGDSAAARDFYQRFLDSYDSEIARGAPEYQDHAPVFPDYQRAARAALGR